MEVKASGKPPIEAGGQRNQIYSRALDRTLPVRDARAEFASASRRHRLPKDSLHAFLENKREIIRSHARLTASEKARALAEIDRMEHGESGSPEEGSASDGGGSEGGEDEPPLPGGVGFGVFYDGAFKMDFESGTAVEYSILCPTTPGGNVDRWLYLTASNRASLGVEAFVGYHAQDEALFLVFDWAREDHWQVTLPFSEIGNYLHHVVLYEKTYQALFVQNFTYKGAHDDWINEVFLRNQSTGALDLVYASDYPARSQDQKTGWEGSWGPIVETFQHLYQGTKELGFQGFSVSSRRGTDWDPWEPLSSEESYVRQDGVGFQMLRLEPNHTFLAVA